MALFDEYFNGYTPAYELMFAAGWSGWEDSGWIFIFEREGRFFQLTGGDPHLMVGKTPDMRTDLVELTQDEALAEMLEWDPNDEMTDDFGIIELRTEDGDGLYAVTRRGYTNDWYAHRENPPRSSGPHRTAAEAFAAVGHLEGTAIAAPATRLLPHSGTSS